MLQLRKWLTSRHDWYEACMQQLAERDGFGHLSRPMFEFMAHIGKEPVGLTEIARQMSVSRQWVARLAREGADMDLLALTSDPADKRALMVQFSESGWRMVRQAVARMAQIEAELARRIGAKNLELLVSVLSMDWGPGEIAPKELEKLEAKIKPKRSKQAA